MYIHSHYRRWYRHNCFPALCYYRLHYRIENILDWGPTSSGHCSNYWLWAFLCLSFLTYKMRAWGQMHSRHEFLLLDSCNSGKKEGTK